MTCNDVERILEHSICGKASEGWLLRASRGALVEEHLENCPACAAKMIAESRLQDALDDLRLSMLDLKPPAAIEKHLLVAFNSPEARRPLPIRFMFYPRLAWTSAAAVLVMAAGLLCMAKLHPGFQLTREKPGNQAGTRSPASNLSAVIGESAPARNTAAENPVTRTGAAAASKGPGISATRAARGRPKSSDEFAWNGGGSIVRVRLPLSSLSALGLPVHDDLSDPRVTADVWMDPFGDVMKVRLVAESRDSD
jgi:hypothetical protein